MHENQAWVQIPTMVDWLHGRSKCIQGGKKDEHLWSILHLWKVMPNHKQNVEKPALFKLFKQGQVGMSSLPSVSSGNATEACISGSPVYPYISIKKIGSYPLLQNKAPASSTACTVQQCWFFILLQFSKKNSEQYVKHLYRDT